MREEETIDLTSPAEKEPPLSFRDYAMAPIDNEYVPGDVQRMTSAGKKPTLVAKNKSVASTATAGTTRGAVSKSSKRAQADNGNDDFESPIKTRENIATNKRKKVASKSAVSSASSKTGAPAKLSMDPFSEIDLQMERIRKSIGGTRGGTKSTADAEDRLVHLVPILSKISDAQSKWSVLEQKVRVEMKKLSKVQYAASTSVIKEVNDREEISEVVVPSLFPRLSESDIARAKDWWNETKLLADVAKPANSAVLSVEHGYKANGLPLSQEQAKDDAMDKEVERGADKECARTVTSEAATQTGESSSSNAAIQTDEPQLADASIQTRTHEYNEASAQADAPPSPSPSPPIILPQTGGGAPLRPSSGESHDAIKIITRHGHPEDEAVSLTENTDVMVEEEQGSDDDTLGPLPEASSAEAVFTLLRVQHASLYQKALLFHPLDLDEVHALTKAAKIKLGKDGLKKLLAQHGVFVSTTSKGKAGSGIKDLNGAKFKRWERSQC